MSAIRLATAGGVILDNVVTPRGRLSSGQMGGNAVYSAVGAWRWCSSVGVIGALCGNYPTPLLDRLAATGIDSSGLVRFPEPVRLSEWFFYREDGSRDDHLYSSADAARPAGIVGEMLTPEAVAGWKERISCHKEDGLNFGDFRRAHPVLPSFMPELWEGAAGIHLAPELPEAQIEFAGEMRNANAIVTIDPGSWSRRMNDAHLDAMMGLADAFLPSEGDLYALVGEGDPAERLRDLGRRGPAIVAVKLGARGCLVLPRDRGLVVHVPALKVDVVDPTGAGDAFSGGFLAGLVETGDPVYAACCGTVSASFAVGHFGALPLLQNAEAMQQRLTSVKKSVRFFGESNAA